jgi:hypothetical protein
MAGKTYGSKPKAFTLEDGGEEFYVGSEVGQYLKFFRGSLYKKFPQLWKRLATPEEKRRLLDSGAAPSYLNTNIMLVRVQEVSKGDWKAEILWVFFRWTSCSPDTTRSTGRGSRHYQGHRRSRSR